MNSIPEIFGSAVFNDEKMRERLPKDVYESLKKTAMSGARLEPNIANVVAEKMKEWIAETIRKEYEEAADHPEYRHFLKGVFPELLPPVRERDAAR